MRAAPSRKISLMKIAGLQKASLIDYPDLISGSIFLAGCNLNCPYCYNRWMIRESRVKEAMSVEELMAWLKSRVGLLDGICISGGEPTIHSRLADLLKPIKAMGYLIKVDTNGTNPDGLAYLLDNALVDYVAVDVKAPFDRRYHVVAGKVVDLVAIHQCLGLVRARAPAYELRTTVGPQLDEQDLRDIARDLKVTDPWFLQLFLRKRHVHKSMAKLPALDERALHRIAEELQAIVPLVKVRGE